RRLADSVEKRMQRKEAVAFNVQLMIRYHNHRNVTRSRQLKNPISRANDIYGAAYFLWKKHWNGKPVRLLGITVQELIDRKEAYKQLDLFTYEEDAKKSEDYETLDETL